MAKRKSVAAKVKARHVAYVRRSQIKSKTSRWTVLLLVAKAIHVFRGSSRRTIVQEEHVPRDDVEDRCLYARGNFNRCSAYVYSVAVSPMEHKKNFDTIKDVVKGIISKVCRREANRKNNKEARKRKEVAKLRVNQRQSGTSKANWFRSKYNTDAQFRQKKLVLMRKYHNKQYKNKLCFRDDHQARVRGYISKRYRTNKSFRIEHRSLMRSYSATRYRMNETLRCARQAFMKGYTVSKYRTNEIFRKKHQSRMKRYLANKYKSDFQERSKKIERTLNAYRTKCSLAERRQRQTYNRKYREWQRRRVTDARKCQEKHRQVYKECLASFRRTAREGPDYICLVCMLRFFRSQVVPYMEKRYIQNTSASRERDKVPLCIQQRFVRDKNWICLFCSEKMKRHQLPNRAVVNNLDVCDVPVELARLNDLEKHIIALRLPFIKIVNLTTGKVANRFSQRGTVGPLHCVPADIQETVRTLPRPINKSMLIRLQLKRRLHYKAIWKEQFINPNDVRDSLLFLTRAHPDYRDITIAGINDDYIESDKNDSLDGQKRSTNEVHVDVDEPMNSASVTDDRRERDFQASTIVDGSQCLNNDDDDDSDRMAEDLLDNRAKYAVGTDCCLQLADFGDYAMMENNPYVVAPAEKNKLSSLLTDKTLEKLAFPHLFPDGRGTFEEEREVKLHWKDYCKARLFSADDRFAKDSTYIFYLQYLGDLKQAFSGINVAFRKKLPMTARETLDDNQMRFLASKDMVYRHLQAVRGSPQFWQGCLKNLFAMNRQLDHPSFFFTLTSADLRWKEFMDVFARQSGETVRESYTFEEKTKLLRGNPVLAARMFERRLNNFMKLFVNGKAFSLGAVEDWFYRIEMQMRGSPHAHMPLWIKNAPKYKGCETDEKTKEEIVKFCDRYISTRFPTMDEDAELHDMVKDVQMHSRKHSKSCLKFHKTICRFGFPRPVSRRTFICEPVRCTDEDEKKRMRNAKVVLIEMNSLMNTIEKNRDLSWKDFDGILASFQWTYDDYEWSLRAIHSRAVIIHQREPNARWINQYNEELLRAWNANMDVQFILNPYACAKYLMSYTTKPEREMSLLLEATHKECREGNMSVREEMKKITGTFFNHRQVSVQEAIYRATKMPLTCSSRGFVFVPAHASSCRFLKPASALRRMDADDADIYMSNLADKYFDRPDDEEFDICMAEFASEYEIVSLNKKVSNPRTPIRPLKTLKFAVKKRCGKNAIIRYPYFNRENDKENYYETLLTLYLPMRKREDFKRPVEMFYEQGEIYYASSECQRRVKDIVDGNREKYEAYFRASEELESIVKDLSSSERVDDWADIVANKRNRDNWLEGVAHEDNPDFDMMRKKKDANPLANLKQVCPSTDTMRPLLESMNEQQQEVFYYVRSWCARRLQDRDVEPLRLFITGGAGTGKSHLLKCLHYEATKIFSQKKHLEPDEHIDEIHTLITAFTGAAAVNVGGVTIHSAFGIGTGREHQNDALSCDRLNSYRCKLGSLKLLFVDEISLVQGGLWGAIHSRLTQIKGTYSNTAIFGNVGVVAIGDFYQCSPVAACSVYSTLLWSDHFEYIELKLNERQKDLRFAETLNRIRKLKRRDELLKEDRELLEKCHQRYLNKEYNPQALHLFAKNCLVDAHNQMMIEKVCSDIRTLYETDCHGKDIRHDERSVQKKANKTLKLALDARVMLTKNLCVSDGLANGVMGRVAGFVESDHGTISRVLIQCDSKAAGRAHRRFCSFCRERDTICVERENDIVDQDRSQTTFKSGTKQFPLRLSWALTVHKAQGLTVPEVVIGTKDFFGNGMGYTALSRNQTSERLSLIDLHLEKFYCNKEVDDVLDRMQSMRQNPCIFRTGPEHLNILFHNIERLPSNFRALQNNRLTKKADLICLVETWLTGTDDLNQYQLTGYRMLHRSRSSAFGSSHPLHRQRGGGVCIYYRDEMQMKTADGRFVDDFEYLTVELEEKKVFVIACYRPAQLDKKSFLTGLTRCVHRIGLDKKILILGDLNEDGLSNHSNTIESHLARLGFSNLFKGRSTTKNFSSLDCVYSNFLQGEKYRYEVAETFYSYHHALICSIGRSSDSTMQTWESDGMNLEPMEVNRSGDRGALTPGRSVGTSKRKFPHEESTANKRRRLTGNGCEDKHCELASKNKCIKFLKNLKERTVEQKADMIESTLTMEEQLALLHLKHVDVLGDGNCFFRAISHQLYNHENSHREIRLMSVHFIETNPDIFRNFLGERYRTIGSYVGRMRRDGTYADYLSISSTAIVIRKNIVVHEAGKQPLLIPGSDYIDDQVHVSYDYHHLHYKSVVSVNNDKIVLAPENLLCV